MFCSSFMVRSKGTELGAIVVEMPNVTASVEWERTSPVRASGQFGTGVREKYRLSTKSFWSGEGGRIQNFQ